MAYKRTSGPWKRYANLAGGNALAGAFFDHILLRYRTKDGLVEREGTHWIVQSFRCWMQEVPLSKRALSKCMTLLQEAGLVEVVTRPFSNSSPSPVTHICLTSAGMEYARRRSRTSVSEPTSQSDHSGSADSPAKFNSICPTACHKKLSTQDSYNKILPLAPNGAGEIPLQDKKSNNKEEYLDAYLVKDANEELTSNFHQTKIPAHQIEAIWHAAHKNYAPQLPCSSFHGHKWHFAKVIAQALGANAEETIQMVVRDWESFRDHVKYKVGGRIVAEVPDLAALATFIDAAQLWATTKSAAASKDSNSHLSPEAKKLYGIT